MSNYFRIFGSLLLLSFLFSCASTDKRSAVDLADELRQSESGNFKYEAWRLNQTGQFEAINVLLDETDVLIESHAFNAAADKLERVLRIMPDYAPAWSRLSWLALQMNSPKRSVQMAKRSNSFAYSDPELQSLNWTFIRAASKALDDEDSYHRANQKIESLKIF